MIALSIVVVAYNEKAFIQETLRRMLHAMSGSSLNYEILVVDNGSTDETASMAAAFQTVQVLRLGRRVTISSARNIGASRTRGELLAFIDADVFVTSEWARHVETKIRGLLAGGAIVTGGQYRVSENPSWIERNWFKSMEERLPNYINGGNVIVTRKTFEKVNGFRSDLVTGEDVDLCRRARVAGGRIEPDAGFAVHHEGYPKTLDSFFRRELWAGRGDYSSFSAFRASKTATTGVAVLLLLIASVILAALGAWPWSLAALASVLLIAVASVQFKYGFRSLPRFVSNTAIMILHLIARSLSFLRYEKKT